MSNNNAQIALYPPFKRAGTIITQRTSGDDVNSTGNIFLPDNKYFRFGNTLAGPDGLLGWNTGQTDDGLFLGLATGKNNFIIAEVGDINFDFGHLDTANPTVFVHSASQSTTQWLSFSHNQTDGVIRTGTGGLIASSTFLQFPKLGTATVGVPVYNSPDMILQNSVWDTDGSEDTWQFKFRTIPVSAANTTANIMIYSQKNAIGEVQILNIDYLGALTAASSLNSSTGIAQSVNTAMTIKGWAPNGATADGVIIDTGVDLTIPGANLLSIKNFNVEKAYVDYLGSFNAGAGTALLPAYSFAGDPDTGLYSNSTNALFWTFGGVASISMGNNLINVNVLSAYSTFLSIKGQMGDVPSAYGTKIGTTIALTNTTAKIAGFFNDAGTFTVEKAYVDYLGNVFANGVVSTTVPVYSSTTDTNTGIGFGSADNLNLIVSGNSRAIFTPSYLVLNDIAVTCSDTVILKIAGRPTDGATAIANKIGCFNLLANETAKITAFYNDAWTTEKSSIDIYGGYSQISNNVTTVNATPVVISTITIPATNMVYWVEATVIADKSDHTERAAYKLKGFFYRAAGGATQEGATIIELIESNVTPPGAGPWGATFSVSVNDIQLNVTGAAYDVKWKSSVTFTARSTA